MTRVSCMVLQECEAGDLVSTTTVFNNELCLTTAQLETTGMEDTNACSLKLDEGKDNSNSFFAVYDGHGGEHRL
jgi:serine/threonine protein phosphatase PrpC